MGVDRQAQLNKRGGGWSKRGGGGGGGCRNNEKIVNSDTIYVTIS